MSKKKKMVLRAGVVARGTGYKACAKHAAGTLKVRKNEKRGD